MKRILIVSRDISLKKDGGSLVSIRNERLLNMLGCETKRFIIPIPSLMTRLKNILFRQSYGETKKLRKRFLEVINLGYDYIFFDGSIYGGFLKLASEKNIKTICFYHNVEVEYYRQKANQTHSIADRIMVSYIGQNEKLSTEYSTKLISLNDRDSKHLEIIYGRKADVLLPTSFPYRAIAPLYKSRLDQIDPYLLFVGTNFFANIEGLKRFMTFVAPYVNHKIKIVGNIRDAFIQEKNIPENIEFIGRVDSLEKFYLNAIAVIAPIFTGSGLKTKTVEALSYGKTVVGFSEAFEGIDCIKYPKSCIVVNSDKEFIEVLNNIDTTMRYNPASEKLFQEQLSDEAQYDSLKRIFDSV